MNSYKYMLISALTLLLSSNTMSQDGIAFDHSAWQEVLAQASNEDKVIFVDAYTTWCGPCKWMSSNVFTDATVGEFYNEHFINVKMDMEKGDGLVFSKKYEVRAYPTLLFINGDGELVHKGLGARSVEEFIKLGNYASNTETQWTTLNHKYINGDRDPQMLKTYVDVLDGAGMDKYEAINAYLKTQKDWKTLDNAEFIFKHAGYDVSNYLFQYILQERSMFEAFIGIEKLDKKLDDAVSMSLPPEADATQLREAYQQYFPNDWQKKYNVSLIRNITDGTIDVSLDETVRITNRYINDYKEEKNWNLLNSIAWYMFEETDEEKYLEAAASWAMRSIEIESNYYNNDTAAWIYYKLGDTYKATAFGDIAIKLGLEKGADISDTQALIKMINGL